MTSSYCEQTVEHVDRGVERRAQRAVLLLAVPAAVVHPLAEHALDQRLDVDAEVGARLDGATVDARLDLAVEVALLVVLPASVLRDQCDRLSSAVRRGVEPEQLQRLQCVHGGGPRLGFPAAPPIVAGEAGTAVPEPVRVLEPEQPRAPALVLDASALDRDHLGLRVVEIAPDLPADGRVALEQPCGDVHRRRLPPASDHEQHPAIRPDTLTTQRQQRRWPGAGRRGRRRTPPSSGARGADSGCPGPMPTAPSRSGR